MAELIEERDGWRFTRHGQDIIAHQIGSCGNETLSGLGTALSPGPHLTCSKAPLWVVRRLLELYDEADAKRRGIPYRRVLTELGQDRQRERVPGYDLEERNGKD